MKYWKLIKKTAESVLQAGNIWGLYEPSLDYILIKDLYTRKSTARTSLFFCKFFKNNAGQNTDRLIKKAVESTLQAGSIWGVSVINTVGVFEIPNENIH